MWLKYLETGMKDRIDKREAVTIPTYTLKKQKKKLSKKILILALLAAIVFGTIYLPPIIVDEVDNTTHLSIDMTGYANFAALETGLNLSAE